MHARAPLKFLPQFWGFDPAPAICKNSTQKLRRINYRYSSSFRQTPSRCLLKFEGKLSTRNINSSISGRRSVSRKLSFRRRCFEHRYHAFCSFSEVFPEFSLNIFTKKCHKNLKEIITKYIENFSKFSAFGDFFQNLLKTF